MQILIAGVAIELMPRLKKIDTRSIHQSKKSIFFTSLWAKGELVKYKPTKQKRFLHQDRQKQMYRRIEEKGTSKAPEVPKNLRTYLMYQNTCFELRRDKKF